jgi:nitrogen fixation NifU-like protein
MADDPFDEIQNMVIEDAGRRFSRRVVELFMEPQNFGILNEFVHFAAIEGNCGETVVIYVAVNKGIIERISFVSDVCGPTMACSSAVTCMAQGLSLSQAASLTSGDLIDFLGGLPPDKTQCAEIAVKALHSVLLKATET